MITYQEWWDSSNKQKVDFVYSLDAEGIKELVERSTWTFEQVMTVSMPLCTEYASDEFERASTHIMNTALEWQYLDKSNPNRYNIPPKMEPVFEEITRPNPGFVYLMKCQELYKIGRSTKPEQRRRAIQGSGAFDIDLVHTIKSNDMIALEQSLHRKFSGKRARREWFALDGQDVEYIKGLAQ